MAVQCNALEQTEKYSSAAKTVKEAFYVDDCLTGADNVESAITLHQELQDMLEEGKGSGTPRNLLSLSPFQTT